MELEIVYFRNKREKFLVGVEGAGLADIKQFKLYSTDGSIHYAKILFIVCRIHNW